MYEYYRTCDTGSYHFDEVGYSYYQPILLATPRAHVRKFVPCSGRNKVKQLLRHQKRRHRRVTKSDSRASKLAKVIKITAHCCKTRLFVEVFIQRHECLLCQANGRDNIMSVHCVILCWRKQNCWINYSVMACVICSVRIANIFRVERKCWR